MILSDTNKNRARSKFPPDNPDESRAKDYENSFPYFKNYLDS